MLHRKISAQFRAYYVEIQCIAVVGVDEQQIVVHLWIIGCTSGMIKAQCYRISSDRDNPC